MCLINDALKGPNLPKEIQVRGKYGFFRVILRFGL